MSTTVHKNEAIEILADNIHKNWQKEYKEKNGTDSTRWKAMSDKDAEWIGNLAAKKQYPLGADSWYFENVRKNTDGVSEVNILGLPNSYLPPKFSAENTASAKGVIEAILSDSQKSEEYLASVVHNQWIDRNKSWAPTEQMLPYSALSENEKEKDRIIVREALQVLKNFNQYREAKFELGDSNKTTYSVGKEQFPIADGVSLNIELGDIGEVKTKKPGFFDKMMKNAVTAAALFVFGIGAATLPVNNAHAGGFDFGGAVGAVLGAALGNQVGEGNGKMIATAAGANIGGQIGNSSPSYQSPRIVSQNYNSQPVRHRTPSASSEPGIMGGIVGGLVGGAAGSRVGEGNGKTAMTIVGTMVGAVAGNAIQNGSGDQVQNVQGNNYSQPMTSDHRGLTNNNININGKTYQVVSGPNPMDPEMEAGFDRQVNNVVIKSVEYDRAIQNYERARKIAISEGTSMPYKPSDSEVRQATKKLMMNLDSAGREYGTNSMDFVNNNLAYKMAHPSEVMNQQQNNVVVYR